MTVRVEVQYACRVQGLPSPREVRRWARAALAPERPQAELTVRIVGEEEGARLNRTYRRRAGATNVLSFPFEAPSCVPLPLIGDLVICAPVVAREAREQGKPAAAHWAHLVVHGVLHLIGHDHRRAADARRMEALEIEILARLGFPDPYRPAQRGPVAEAPRERSPSGA